MKFAVQMTLADSGRSTTPQEGFQFIQTYVLPTLEQCAELERAGTIVGGGPIIGTIGMLLIIEADSAQQLETIIEHLPLWPRMNTTVTPLTTFEGRTEAVKGRLQQIQARMQAASA